MFQLNDTDALRSTAYNTANAGGDSLVALAAVTNNYHVIDWVSCSYDASPASGELKIVDNTNSNAVLYSVAITAAGPNHYLFSGGFKCPKSSQVTTVLVDGNTVKKLNVGYR